MEDGWRPASVYPDEDGVRFQDMIYMLLALGVWEMGNGGGRFRFR